MKAAQFWTASQVYMHASGYLKSCNTVLDPFKKGVRGTVCVQQQGVELLMQMIHVVVVLSHCFVGLFGLTVSTS